MEEFVKEMEELIEKLRQADTNVFSELMEIARLNIKEDLKEWDWRGTDFSCSKLSEADFSNSDLSYCEFVGADLRNANFSGCNLKFANFTNANTCGCIFDGANTEFAVNLQV